MRPAGCCGPDLHVRADDANYTDFAAFTDWETFFDRPLVPGPTANRLPPAG